MEEKLKLGRAYTDTCILMFEDNEYVFPINGVVVYNDGETAVIRINHNDGTIIEDFCFKYMVSNPYDFISYEGLQYFNLDFNDPEGDENTHYICIDIETETMLTWSDLSEGITSDDESANDTHPSYDDDLPF